MTRGRRLRPVHSFAEDEIEAACFVSPEDERNVVATDV